MAPAAARLSRAADSSLRRFAIGASRDCDPLPHTHLLVANVVQADDGRWGTVDATWLYRHAKTAGYLPGPTPA